MEAVGVGRRAVAIIIDTIVLGIVGWLIGMMTGQTTESGFNLQGMPALLFFLVALAYYVVMEKTSGATLGKMAMKLKVVKQDGGAIDWQASIIRNLLRIVDGLFFYLVGAIVVWVSKSRQRLGDMAAKTLVVRAQSWVPVLGAALLLAFAPGEALAAPKLDKIVISDARDGERKTTFKPNTAKVFVRADLVDVPNGATIRGEWIAVKTAVTTPNQKIASSDTPVNAGNNKKYTFTVTPSGPLPEGDYRIDLFIDGKPAAQVPFKVVK